MLTHRGFSAWIVSGEETIQEHLVAVDTKSHRVSCWIPGEAGKTFSVYWRDHGGNVDTCSFITLDGYVVPGRFLFGTGVAWRQGVRTGPSTERPFIFSNVEDTSDETGEGSSKELGMIVLRIKRVERSGSRPANTIQKVPDPRVGNRRPGNLCVGFGTEQPAYAQYSTTWAVKAYHKDKPNTGKPSTYVSFVFRYRSREFLQTQGIMPEVGEPADIPVRRIASAPATPMRFPSPSPHPSPKGMESSVNLLTPSKPPRRFPKATSSRKVGHPKGSARLPGEGLILFDYLPPETARKEEEEEDVMKCSEDGDS